MNANADLLKRACPMPTLLHKMGLGKFARKSVRSPFREDQRPSWGIFQRDGKWFFKDQGTGDCGDEIALLARWKGLDEKRDFPQLLKLYMDLAGISPNGETQQPPGTVGAVKQKEPFSWSSCVADFTPLEAEKLATWRGYSPEFSVWLRAENLIGLHKGKWALPVHGGSGAVVGCHYRVDRGTGNRPDWFYYPKGLTVRPLVFGDPKRGSIGFVFESPWDSFAVMDRLGWHRPNGVSDTAIVVTRGAGNGRLIAGILDSGSTVYAFKQNDETKNGLNPANQWLADVCAHAGSRVFEVATPLPFKDLNEWTQGGAAGADIMAAIQDAKLVHTPPDFSGGSMGGENIQIVECDPPEIECSKPLSTFSTLSTGKHTLASAIYPADSLLARYLDYARRREESADSYLIGSFLPVVAATLARRVWFPWGDGRVYPNLFTMLAGKPGDRKSSAANLAEKVARAVIDKMHFLPEAMSAEAMFDEYDQDAGGSPDKLLIDDDANAFLGMLRKSNYGERVGQRLLKLYDCKGMGETFRRNQQDHEGTGRRYIPETSTSMVLGATFNICQFQGHEIRTGLQRRFLYYLAEGHGRFIAVPAKSDEMEFLALCERLAKTTKLTDIEFQFSPDGGDLWTGFQKENRKRLAEGGFGAAREAYLARLNGQPNHVLKIAMVFQVALWAETATEPHALIEAETLQTAIDHSELCLAAAQALDGIANRAQIQQDAEVLLANIVQDFKGKSANGSVQLTRTELTGRYAHHSGRKGAVTPDDLYLRLIPDLIGRGKACEVPRPGRQSAFAFKAEEVASKPEPQI